MAIQLLILVVGLALIVFGADWLVDGASGIARKAGISEFVIGLTIVGFGTSCPELVVSLTGAIAGKSDISAGNVIGSNIFNTLLILGLTAVISPIAITHENKRRDIPMTIAVTLLFILCGMSVSLFGLGEYDGISRIEGALFLILFAIYIYRCFKTGSAPGTNETEEKQLRLGVAFALVAAGLAGLIIGGKLFVNSATEIARMAGVSNWKPERIREANAYAEAHGLIRLAANQPQFSLARQVSVPDPTTRGMDAGTWKMHAETGMTCCCFTSQAHGYFTRLDRQGEGSLPESLRREFDCPESRATLERIRAVREETGLSVGSIALAWLISQPFPVFPLAGASRAEHVEALREAGDAMLTDRQRDLLRSMAC